MTTVDALSSVDSSYFGCTSSFTLPPVPAIVEAEVRHCGMNTVDASLSVNSSSFGRTASFRRGGRPSFLNDVHDGYGDGVIM